MSSELVLPGRLAELVSSGAWAAIAQPTNVWSLVDEERVQLVFPGETRLDLQCPPFHTVSVEIFHSPELWRESGAIEEIDAERALIIGDFGLGSDSAIVLDYERSLTSPSVRWLQWGVEGNHWLEAAPTFDALADALALG
jgi:hypothetical protein